MFGNEHSGSWVHQPRLSKGFSIHVKEREPQQSPRRFDNAVMEGVIAIESEMNPTVLKTKLLLESNEPTRIDPCPSARSTEDLDFFLQAEIV